MQRVATGLEMVREKISQYEVKNVKFYFESGKTDILKKSQRKSHVTCISTRLVISQWQSNVTDELPEVEKKTFLCFLVSFLYAEFPSETNQ